jgi:hypothetical protein
MLTAISGTLLFAASRGPSRRCIAECVHLVTFSKLAPAGLSPSMRPANSYMRTRKTSASIARPVAGST